MRTAGRSSLAQRQAIEDWFERKATSPATGQPIANKQMLVNHALLASIHGFASVRAERKKTLAELQDATVKAEGKERELKAKDEEIVQTKQRLVECSERAAKQEAELRAEVDRVARLEGEARAQLKETQLRRCAAVSVI